MSKPTCEISRFGNTVACPCLIIAGMASRVETDGGGSRDETDALDTSPAIHRLSWRPQLQTLSDDEQDKEMMMMTMQHLSNYSVCV